MNIKPYLKALKSAGFQGDIDVSLATRTVMATDNSVYELLPAAVLFPRDQQDVQLILSTAQYKEFSALTFTPRGGGTSTNGQSLGQGIVIDCSRYMCAIKSLDVAQGVVEVEPGVVLDQLNRFLAPHGLFFPVNISTGSRATLGGMANTNACGKGSTYYGRMSDNVSSITSVLANGEVLTATPVLLNKLSQKLSSHTCEERIYQQVYKTVTEHAEEIKALYPTLMRTLTGYTLGEVINAERDHFNLNAILVGSEGTLSFFTELTLKVHKIPRVKRLLVLQYRNFMAALEDGAQLTEFKPEAVETLDEKILSLAKRDILYASLKPLISNEKEEVGGLNLMELVADSEADLDQAMQLVSQHLERSLMHARLHYQWVEDSSQIKLLWELRKKCVGLLGNFELHGRRPVSGIEDTLVPPQQLKAYIHDLCELLDAHGLTYGMFGHVDAGCVHVRPALNLRDKHDEALYYDLVRKVAALVARHNGILWGEHGKGLRSSFVPKVYGETLFNELCKIKAAFDPGNRLNPGRIAVPLGEAGALAQIDAFPLQAQHNRVINSALAERYHRALACNGNGVCFDKEASHIICPSYKVTNDRVHSPKGRALLARQWLRLRSEKPEAKENKSFSFWKRLGFSLLQRHDFSHEVYAAMNGCLGCRACQTQCPVQVNVPSFKSSFLVSYYSRYLRSFANYCMARSENYAIKQSAHPKLYNALTQNIVTRFAMKKLGLVDLPKLSVPSVTERLKAQKMQEILREAKANDIVLLQDFVTSSYEAELVPIIFNFLQSFGRRVWLLERFINGKAWHAQGCLKNFDFYAKANITRLERLTEKNVTLVGIDPSITLTYRHEYAEAYPKHAINVQLLEELLMSLPLQASQFQHCDKPIVLLLHCTEAATDTERAVAWQTIFQRCGFTVTIAAVGCCGMAGGYGLQREHRDLSKKLFEMSWLPHLNNQSIILATGYSCRAQIRRFSSFTVEHPLQFLSRYLCCRVD